MGPLVLLMSNNDLAANNTNNFNTLWVGKKFLNGEIHILFGHEKVEWFFFFRE
jgi:hypothetical protein